MSAAVRASTSSKSSEAFTSSPISASVASISAGSAECGPPKAESVCVPGGFIPIDSITGAHSPGSATVRSVRGGNLQNSNMGQVPVAFCEIQSKSHNEFIRYCKTNIIRMNICDSPFHLVQQHGNPQMLWLPLLQNSQQILQR